MGQNGNGNGRPGEVVYVQNVYYDQDGRTVIAREAIRWPGESAGAPQPHSKYKAQFILRKKVAVGNLVGEESEPLSIAIEGARSLDEAWLLWQEAVQKRLAKENEPRLYLPVSP